jgi:hypothetical protein
MMLKKIAIALAALAMPLSSTAATTAATTAGAIHIELRFYSDYTMTQEIGGTILYCDNTTLVWGEQFTSMYYTEVVNDCE